MARTADHDQRRRQIADAVCAVVAGGGFGAATMAGVAKEAGFSVGLVQHYFASKDDLLLFAFEGVTADIAARAERFIVAGVDDKQPIATVLRNALVELMPLDDARRVEYRVSRAFLGRSLDNAALSAVAAAHAARVRDQIAVSVTNGKECGEVASDVDAGLAAVRISALVDGLAGQLYADAAAVAPFAEDALSATLAEVFTGECRQYA